MELELKDKRVLITASVQGIGFATAKAFLKEGAKVIINGRNEERLCHSVSLLEKEYHGKVFSFLGDMRLRDEAENLKELLLSRFGGLDVLVSNLGSGKPESVNPLNLEEWKRFYDINVLSSVRILDSLHSVLVKGENPAVILISSVVSKEAASAPVGYASAKSAVRTLNKYLSRLWVEDGIRVNCVLPGNIYFKGGRWEELVRRDSDGIAAYIKSAVPMKRFGKPEEIADTIVFLASSRSSFTTGAEIAIDGGQLGTI